MPKVYGTPTGAEAPDPKRKQRAATPGNAHDYMQHMIEADRAYHAQRAQSQAPARPRGSSSYDAQGNFKPARARPPMRVEKALKDAGE